MSDEPAILGACHCGAVRYEVATPLQFQFLCHCDNCRRQNGGLRLAGASVPRDALSVSGETTRYSYAGGKDEIELHFCGTCGTPLFAHARAYPGIAVVRANSLDDHDVFSPRKSTHGDQACAWETLLGAS